MEFWGSIIRKKISMLWTHTFLHHLCPSLATELQMKLVGCPFSPTKIVPLFAPGGLRISSESVWWLSTIASRHTLSSSSSSVEYSSVCAPSGGDIEVECQSGKKKKKTNLCQIQYWVGLPAALYVYHVDTGFDWLAGKSFCLQQELSSHLERAEVQIVYIFTPVPSRLCWLLHCSLRCITSGKTVNISIHICSQNVLWLTFHWSRLSLWLPQKIGAVLEACQHESMVGGGVFKCGRVWLVWVAAADCGAFSPMISALYFSTTAHPLLPQKPVI